ncbi:Microtubule-associated protein, microtubule dynamics during spindle orientation, partial [Dinochytrium kinnereticum]
VASSSEDPADELFPRVDISTVVSNELLDNLGDAQWKVRKEGLEELAKLLETNKRIKPNLGELLPALKARLTDSNKNLAMLAVEICGTIAVAMGKPFERHAKIMFSPMAGLLADQKNHIRSAAMTAINNVFTACGLEPCLSSIAQSLMIDQPQLRKDLLKWFTEKLDATKEEGITLVEVQPLVHPILLCLQDKNADVRKPASVVLAMLGETVGMNPIVDRAGELFKGAALQSLSTYFEAARASSKPAPAAVSSLKAPTTPTKLKRASTVVTNSEAGAKSRIPGGSVGVPKSGKARPATIIGTLSLKREAPAAAASAEMSDPVMTSDFSAKEARANQDRGLTKWTFDAPRRELIDFLQEQCEGNIFAGIVSLMFSTDHYKEKDFISALTMLDEGIISAQSTGNDDLVMAYVCNSDLILKYITIRLFDTNTSMLIKCLELLEHLFSLLDNQNVLLSDYEASSFLPFFINKTGDNKETMRVKIRSILKQICRVYPASKLFGFLLEGLKSKNSRTRTECLEELADIIKKNGMSVCSPSRVFPVIAAQISDSDAKVRNAALGVVTQAYMLVGDAVYKYVGRLSDKDKSLIEEKLKRLPPPSIGQAPPATLVREKATSMASLESLRQQSQSSQLSSAAGSRASVQSMQDMMPSSLARLKERTQSAGMVGAPSRPTSMYGSAPSLNQDDSGSFPVKKEFSLDLDKLNRPRGGQDSLMSSLSRPGTSSSSLGNIPGLRSRMDPVSPFNSAAPPASKADSNVMDIIVTQITAGDAYQSIDALKQLEKVLTSSMAIVLPHLDEVISAITLQIRIAFTAADLSSPGTGRLCKHLVNVLVQIFTIPELAKETGIEPLQQCMQELLKRLLDPNLQQIEQGPQLARALNVLMVRILENCDRNKSFSTLLNLLQQSTMETIKASPQDVATHAKYTELVMKCLWKMTKVIPQLFEQNVLDAGKLILAIHEFLEVSPPSDWKRRAAEKTIPQADMPLRTVKTILHEIVSVFGENAMDYAALISDQERSHAVTYLRSLIDQARKKASGSSTAVASRETSNPSSRASPVEHMLSRTTGAIQQSPGSTYTNGINGTSGRPENLPLPAPKLNSRPMSPSLRESEADRRIAIIFQKMSQKDETKQGISDLYEFRKNHPEAEEVVKAYYERTSPYFRSYIRRALLTLDENFESKAAAPANGDIGGLSSAKRASAFVASSASPVSTGGSSGTSFGSRPMTTSGAGSTEDGFKLNSVESYQQSLLKYQQMLSRNTNETESSGIRTPPDNESLHSDPAKSSLDSLAWRGSS